MVLGDDEFRKELLERMIGRAGPGHYGEEVREAAGEKAERMVIDGLKRLKWTESDLQHRAKGDAKKVALAARLREETTMPMKWIAARLGMGSAAYASDQ